MCLYWPETFVEAYADLVEGLLKIEKGENLGLQFRQTLLGVCHFYFQRLQLHLIFSSCPQGFRGSIFHFVFFYRTRVRLVHALRTLRAFQTLNHSTSSSACVHQASLEKFVLSVSMKKQLAIDIIVACEQATAGKVWPVHRLI